MTLAYSILKSINPCEDFGKVYHRGSVNFQMHLPFVWFLDQVYHKGSKYLNKCQKSLFVQFMLSLCDMFRKSSYGVV